MKSAIIIALLSYGAIAHVMSRPSDHAASTGVNHAAHAVVLGSTVPGFVMVRGQWLPLPPQPAQE